MTYADRKREILAEAKAHGHNIERESETDTRWQYQGRCRKCGGTVNIPREIESEWFKVRRLDVPCQPRMVRLSAGRVRRIEATAAGRMLALTLLLIVGCSVEQMSPEEIEVGQMFNATRLRPATLDSHISVTCRKYAEYLADLDIKPAPDAHTMDGLTPTKRARAGGLSGRYSEVLARSPHGIKGCVKLLFDSAPHYRVITSNRSNMVGVGVAHGSYMGIGCTTVVAMFRAW